MKNRLSFVILFATLILPRVGQASGFEFGSAGSATDSSVGAILKLIAVGAEHRPYVSARPLGVRGFEFGGELTGVLPSSEFKDALTTLGSTARFDTLFMLPRIVMRKGLPGRLDLGLSLLAYSGFLMAGADLQWSLLSGQNRAFHAAVRASYQYTDIDVVRAQSQSVQLVLSRSSARLEPYVRIGYQLASGTLSLTGVPAGVATTQDFKGVRYALGLPLKLRRLRFAPEYEGGSLGISSVGAKLSLEF
jgi:hypothetical protein